MAKAKNCKCCGQGIGHALKGVHRVRFQSDDLKEMAEALIAYCGIESVDLHTGTVMLTVEVEDDEEYYSRIHDIRAELIGKVEGSYSVEYAK
jgi:hypothetical protein